jgi:hypothetical protein
LNKENRLRMLSKSKLKEYIHAGWDAKIMELDSDL